MYAHTNEAWHRNAGTNMSQARGGVAAASGQVGHSRGVHVQAAVDNLDAYDKVTDALHEKVTHTEELIDDLENRLQSIKGLLKNGKQSLAKLEAALVAKEAPLELCQWHQDKRQVRPTGEMVNDVVEGALQEEHTVITDTQMQLRDAVKRTQNQIFNLQTKQKELEHDLGVKKHALEVDRKCLAAAEASHLTTAKQLGDCTSEGGIASSRGPLRTDDHHPPMQQGRGNEFGRDVRHVQQDDGAKQAEEEASFEFSQNDALIGQCHQAVSDAAARSEQALQTRIFENRQARRNLESHLKETEEQIAEVCDTISDTRHKIHAMDEPVQMASQATNERQKRLHHENIWDPVSSRLSDQHATAVQARERLKYHQHAEHQRLAHLQECRDNLLDDIRAKQNAFKIDADCLTNSSLHPIRGLTDEDVDGHSPVVHDFVEETPASLVYTPHRTEYRCMVPDPRFLPGGGSRGMAGNVVLAHRNHLFAQFQQFSSAPSSPMKGSRIPRSGPHPRHPPYVADTGWPLRLPAYAAEGASGSVNAILTPQHTSTQTAFGQTAFNQTASAGYSIGQTVVPFSGSKTHMAQPSATARSSLSQFGERTLPGGMGGSSFQSTNFQSPNFPLRGAPATSMRAASMGTTGGLRKPRASLSARG
mmetsp:Transcript_116774/g.232756  ORF Transcript_116774/g.232756 Transcript_116774/m.232756 type:complete len:646 (-) Transcript_116774:159-2096(-)